MSALLPFEVIHAAAGGDADAIRKVLAHYEKYISALSTRSVQAEEGAAHSFLDVELQCRLENKLVSRILAFDASTMVADSNRESIKNRIGE